jgi:AAA15 family ATPase/GTPase
MNKLISFQVENYLSFSTKQTINFEKNITAIYGSNSAGKSNLFKALNRVKQFIDNSTKTNQIDLLNQPFLLNNEFINKEIKFRIEITNKRHIYKYSFGILRNKITSEKLYRKSTKPNAVFDTIFSRDSINKGRYRSKNFTSDILRKTRPNTLILTKGYENNNKYSIEFFSILMPINFVSVSYNPILTADMILQKPEIKTEVIDLLQKADLHIQDVDVNKIKFENVTIDEKLIPNQDGYNISFSHIVRDKRGEFFGVRKLPYVLESTGTKRIFELAFAIIDTTRKGNSLYIDEFETYLHNKECQLILSMFKKSNAQLIINSHNTSIINSVGRNALRIIGKNNLEQSVIGDAPKNIIRNDDKNLDKKYELGIMGGIPNVKF